MAITRKTSENPDELSLIINNGDLAALKEVVSRLGFKDEESLLRYALAVLSKSATRRLEVIDLGGKCRQFNPTPVLLS